MTTPISDFRMHLSLPRQKRPVARGIPVIELWVSGPDFVFHRVTGICDTGASRTLLSRATWDRLGYKIEDTERRYPSNGLTRQIFSVRRLLQMRITARNRPPVHIVLNAGLTEDIEENLFGADLIEYFSLLVTNERVFLLGDREEIR